MKSCTPSDLTALINQCNGTEKYWKNWLGLIYTDGVKAVCEMAGSYWLLDVIASYNRKEEFQVWTLEVKEDNSAVVTMKEDSHLKAKVRQEIPYTDFPVGKWSFWMENGVLILPSEH